MQTVPDAISLSTFKHMPSMPLIGDHMHLTGLVLMTCDTLWCGMLFYMQCVTCT